MTSTHRLTRAEQQQQTRAALIDAAGEAFLTHGYDAVALADIAEAAGCTTGAIYANFDGKDGLLLAVLDARMTPSLSRQARLLLAEDLELDVALRRVSRFLLREYEEDPRWVALTADYWARAARDKAFRDLVARRHELILQEVSELLDNVARSHGRRFIIPAIEVARGAGAMVRGIRLERAIGVLTAPLTTFEEMFAVLVTGYMEVDQ